MTCKNENSTFFMNKEDFLFFTAQEFFKTGLSKMKILERPNMDSNEYYIWQLPVPFTNISFAIELIFKSFLNKPINTHCLLELYLKIPSPIRDEIENAFESIQYNFIYIALGNTTPDPPKGETSHELIVEALNRNKNPFVSFRYLHEIDMNSLTHFDPSCMARLCHAALKVKAIKLNHPLEI